MSTINVTNLSGRGGATPNLPDGANITGVATATTFSGTLDGSLKSTGTPTLGLGVTINASGVSISGVATAGIVSATTLYGDGSNLTGVGESIGPWYYNPDVNDVTVPVGTGIGVTFNKKVVAGSGTATLKIVNAGTAGTTIQSWGISSFTQPTVTDITFGSLVSDLIINQTYQFDIPSGFIKDSNDTDYVGTAWTFSVESAAIHLFTWGNNQQGMLGQNSIVLRSSPVQVPGNNWQTIIGFRSQRTTGGTKSDGTLWAWGHSDGGMLGQNGVPGATCSSPVQIAGTTWSKVVGSGDRSWVVTKTDGTLWAWGRGAEGQTAQNDRVARSSPIQIPGTTWPTSNRNHISKSGKGIHVIKTNGTLWAWGQNDDGCLGLNNPATTDQSSPVQIPGTTWASVAGKRHTKFAVKTDGTLWSWGANDQGQLGLNNPVNTKYSSPVQVPGTTWSYATSSSSYGTSFGIKTDGTMWSWGGNYFGLLGQNAGENARKSSPTQIPGTTWRSIDAGFQGQAVATKTDGTLWQWGNSSNGALAQNNLVRYSSPVQVPGTDWQSTVSLNYMSTIAFKKDTTP